MSDITTEANRKTHEELRELVANSDWKNYTAKNPEMREQKARWIAAEFYEGTTAYGRKLFASVSKLRELIVEMGDALPTPTAPPTITIEEYHDLLEIARVACHRIPNILTDELDISDDYLTQLEDIANAIPSPVPAAPAEGEMKIEPDEDFDPLDQHDVLREVQGKLDTQQQENKELRLLAREALNTLRLMRDETSKGYAMIMSDREVRSRVCLVWDRLRKFGY